MRRPYRRIRFFIPVFVLIAVSGVTFVVYWLWNNILVAVVPVRAVTFWQALGLLVLSRILFGGFKFGPPRGSGSFRGGMHWGQKWQQMSDEERAKFRNEWRSRWKNRGYPNEPRQN